MSSFSVGDISAGGGDGEFVFQPINILWAFLWGLVSAVSLPIGSVLGMLKDPGKKICSILMAFGAGALLCAVALELFGETLHGDVTEFQSKWPAVALIGGAIVGGICFEILNAILNSQGSFVRNLHQTRRKIRQVKIMVSRRALSQLRKIKAFSQLQTEDLFKIFKSMKREEYKKGDVIFHDIDKYSPLYFILSGSVQISFSQEAREVILNGQTDSDLPIDIHGHEFKSADFTQSNSPLSPSRAISTMFNRMPLSDDQKDEFQNADDIELTTAKNPSNNRTDDQQIQNQDTTRPDSDDADEDIEEKVETKVFGEYGVFGQNYTHPLEGKALKAIAECLEDTVVLCLRMHDLKKIISSRSHLKTVFSGLRAETKEMDRLLRTNYSGALKNDNGDDTVADNLATTQNDEEKLDKHSDLSEVTLHADAISTSEPKEEDPDGDIGVNENIKDEDALNHAVGHSASAAISIWIGIFIDGIPESVVIGMIASVDPLAPLPLVVGVFLSNFPEALSSSVSLRKAKIHVVKIFMMWFSLCIMTGVGSAIGSLVSLLRTNIIVRYFIFFIEGIAAGSMMTVISRTMLPEAFELGGGVVGFSSLMGFLAAVLVKIIFEPVPEAC